MEFGLLGRTELDDMILSSSITTDFYIFLQLSTMGFQIECSDSELLEYVALDRANCRQEDGLMIAAKKAFNAKKYSKAASYFHQAVMLMLVFLAISLIV